jgi:hypothetical protein
MIVYSRQEAVELSSAAAWTLHHSFPITVSIHEAKKAEQLLACSGRTNS